MTVRYGRKTLVGALLVFAITASVTWGIRAGSQPAKTEPHYDIQTSGPWQPRIDRFGDDSAKAVSLADAKAGTSITIMTPTDAAMASATSDITPGAPAPAKTAEVTPSDTTRRTVWVDHQLFKDGMKRDVVALEYNHLEITEAQMHSTWDAPTVYRGMVSQQADPNAYLATVQGSTAYVAPPNNNGVAHPGYVMFMNGDVQITVEGYYPATRLIAIANSLN